MGVRLLAILFLAAAGCATVSAPPSIDDLFAAYGQAGSPGASVLVVRDGEVLLQRSYGLAILEDHTPAGPQTHYRLASVSKQFTAAAILLLAEEGRLTLDDPLSRFFPQYSHEITIRHLLTHASGLADYEDAIPETATVQVKDRDVLRLVGTPYFSPGTSYRYSNTGYALLALIVEEVSGRSFAEFLRQRLFLPLGMNTTVAHEEGVSVVPHRAYGYSREGGGWRRTDQSLTSAVLGDGGIYTSTEELVGWLKALDAGRFAEASVPRVPTDAKGVSYGYGWRIAGEEVSHTGETIGFRNALVRYPSEKLSVVVLTNRNEGEPVELARAVAARFR